MMKRTLIACIVALLSLVSTALYAPRSEANETHCRATKTTACTLENESSHALGIVTLYSTDDSTTLNVPAPGSYYANVSSSVTALKINGQMLDAPTEGNIELADDSSITVKWPLRNVVTITDQAETDSRIH